MSRFRRGEQQGKPNGKMEFLFWRSPLAGGMGKIIMECILRLEQKQNVNEIFFHLHHYLGHAAMVHKILVPTENSKGRKRLKVIAGHIDLKDIDLKFILRLRNHLEHFDERLDKWISEHEGWAFFDKNIVTRTTGFPWKASLRALDAHTFKFQGEEYDLDYLYVQLLKIEQRLTEGIQP